MDQNDEITLIFFNSNDVKSNISITKKISKKLMLTSKLLKYTYTLLNNNKLILTSKGVHSSETLDLFIELWDVIYNDIDLKLKIKNYKPYEFDSIFSDKIKFVNQLNIYHCFHLLTLSNYLELYYVKEFITIFISKLLIENKMPKLDYSEMRNEEIEKLNIEEITKGVDLLVYERSTDL